MTTISLKKIYWDTSCFICFLNPDENERRIICEDILRHAELGELEIWISTWVIVEVIRPKKPGAAPLPPWAIKAIEAVPEADQHLNELWRRYQRAAPTPKLTEAEIARIQGMFEWPFVKKIYMDDRVAQKAVEISRQFGLKSADAVHVASAIVGKCSLLQKWDKDFDKVKHLINVEEPTRITPQGDLFSAAHPIGPDPTDFKGEG